MARHPLRLATEARDHRALAALLAPDVVLHSPVAASRSFVGRESVAELLDVLLDRFEAWECLHEYPTDEGVVLVARARIGGHDVEEAIICRQDDAGLIQELRLFARPLSGVAAFGAVAGPVLARHRGRAGAAVVRLATAPLPAVLALGDRLIGRLVVPDPPSAAGPLPFVDEHRVTVAAPAEAVWRALGTTVGRSTGRLAGLGVRLVGAEQREARGDPLTVGATLPGFVVAEAAPLARLVLTGRHRFSRYALTFRMHPEGAGTVLVAQTRATFPGLTGSIYRGLVIGSGGHRVAVDAMLASVRRLAEARAS
jgi:hypothetical protein